MNCPVNRDSQCYRNSYERDLIWSILTELSYESTLVTVAIFFWMGSSFLRSGPLGCSFFPARARVFCAFLLGRVLDVCCDSCSRRPWALWFDDRAVLMCTSIWWPLVILPLFDISLCVSAIFCHVIQRSRILVSRIGEDGTVGVWTKRIGNLAYEGGGRSGEILPSSTTPLFVPCASIFDGCLPSSKRTPFRCYACRVRTGITLPQSMLAVGAPGIFPSGWEAPAGGRDA